MNHIVSNLMNSSILLWMWFMFTLFSINSRSHSELWPLPKTAASIQRLMKNLSFHHFYINCFSRNKIVFNGRLNAAKKAFNNSNYSKEKKRPWKNVEIARLWREKNVFACSGWYAWNEKKKKNIKRNERSIQNSSGSSSKINKKKTRFRVVNVVQFLVHSSFNGCFVCVCARGRVRVAISPFALHLLNITRHINGNRVHCMRVIIFYASLGLSLVKRLS